MDAEEAQAHQLLAESRLRCLILEVDKEAESTKAVKYRSILDTLVGEDSSGVTQPEASGVLHAARGALLGRTFPTPSSGSEPIARQPSPHPPMPARQPSPHPPMTGRRRNSSPTESSAGSSRRTLRSSNMPQRTTPRPHRTRTLLPRDRFGVDVKGILERAGLTPLILTRAEATRADATPGIEWDLFRRVFGTSHHKSEWSQCDRIQGYENFMCAYVTAQPFMPLNPGEPGLILKLSAVCETQENTFHVLSETQKSGVLHYRGKYKKIALPHTEFIWENLPPKFQELWIRRISNGASPAMRALRAQIDFRNTYMYEPSDSDIQAHLRQQFTDHVTYRVVSAAFRSGKEKLVMEGIQCVEYDSHLATIIQRAVEA